VNNPLPKKTFTLNLPDASKFITTGGDPTPTPTPTPTPDKTETQCKDNKDNDGDGRTDCRDSDCDGKAGPGKGTCESAEDSCSDNYDNDSDGSTDCDDFDCIGVGLCESSALMLAGFDKNSNGFTFKGTNNSKCAAGSYVRKGGNPGGALRVDLGKKCGRTNNISGGWLKKFKVESDMNVTIKFKYRMITNQDGHECGQVMADIDGKNEFVHKQCGKNNSGWQEALIPNLKLKKGVHTLAIGGYLNKKTGKNELTQIFLDNVSIESSGGYDDGGSGGAGGGDGGGDPTGYTYKDDTFKNTKNAKYASGSSSGGVLTVKLGGIDSKNIRGISGGWSKSFNVAKSGNVSIVLDSRLVASRYDKDECSEALVAVDGKPVNNYVIRKCGRGDTGWKNKTTLRKYLSAGKHTITVGGYNNKKTGQKEKAEVSFRNITITTP
jgi:hypothetical protein